MSPGQQNSEEFYCIRTYTMSLHSKESPKDYSKSTYRVLQFASVFGDAKCGPVGMMKQMDCGVKVNARDKSQQQTLV